MEQTKNKVGELKKRLDTLKVALDFDGKKKRLKELELESSQPGFWEDKKRATELMKEMGRMGEEVGGIESLNGSLGNPSTRAEIGAGHGTESLKNLEEQIKKLELKTYLGGEDDDSDVILSIHAGQGGVEAMDWAQMLERMYIKYFDKKGWKWEIVDQMPGEEAGIKSTTLTVEGNYAYGYLKGEAGAHRLVRQSPFNADKLRQTSFALVEVLPQIEETEEIEIRNDDLEWEFFRASSQGGQNVQKVSSAARLRHKPSGIVVACQSQRHQEQNRKIALQLLRAKLWAQKEIQRKAEERKLKGEYKPASWGHQIRSYVLHPYKMVKDLRTGFETRDPDRVLDGELEGLIEAEIKMMV